MTLAFANSKMPPVRALLILCIVLGHFSYYGVPALEPLRQLAPPAVALFLFISGFGLTRSYQRKGKDYLQKFFSRRILRIILPAVLVVFLHLLLVGGSGVGFFTRAGAIFTQGQTLLPHYWFVWAILFDYLLFWLCRKLLPDKLAPWAILAGVILFVVGTALAGFDRCWWICSLAFPTGVFYAEYEEAIYAFCGRNHWNYWLALLVAGAVFAGLYLTKNLICWTLSYVFLTGFLALIIARLPLDTLRLPVLNWFGCISYEVYLIHISAMCFLRGAHVQVASDLLFVVTVLASSIAVAYIIHRLNLLITRR